MSPATSSIIEQTIALQQQTNRLQAINLILLFVANGFIIWATILIRKATRANREWTRTNQEWSDRLRDQERR